MIGPSGRTRVFAYPAPCDMRKGFNSLSGLVSSMGHELVAGDVFLFVGRTKRRAKVIWYDGTGLCLLSKRLDQGHFATLWEQDKSEVELTMSELRLLLEGCKLVGRVPLSPAPIDVTKASHVARTQFC
jgi:transposase